MTSLATLLVPTLAYRPLLDPLPVDGIWLLLLLPLVVGISVVYKTIKTADLRKVPREAALLSAQIVAFMILAAAGLWLITELA